MNCYIFFSFSDAFHVSVSPAPEGLVGSSWHSVHIFSSDLEATLFLCHLLDLSPPSLSTSWGFGFMLLRAPFAHLSVGNSDTYVTGLTKAIVEIMRAEGLHNVWLVANASLHHYF